MLNNAATALISKIHAVFNIADTTELISDVNLATIGTVGDVRDASHWLQREKFLNFSEVEVAIPAGMSCSYMDFITTFEKIWMNHLSLLTSGLLDPVKANLAIVANDPARAATALTIRELNTSYLLYKTQPNTVRKQIADMFNGPKVDKVKLGKVIHSASEYEAVLLRAVELRGQITDNGTRLLKQNIETIKNAVDLILEHSEVSGLDTKLANHLSNEVNNAAQWVELHGIYLLTLDEAINSLHAIQEKISKLMRKK